MSSHTYANYLCGCPQPQVVEDDYGTVFCLKCGGIIMEDDIKEDE